MYTWTYDNVVKLIDIYKAKDILWDSSRKEYKNKTLKNEAWLNIAKTFDLDRVEVESKIHTLRSQFAREHKKVISGQLKDGKLWFGYDMLRFLLKQEEGDLDHEDNAYEMMDDSNDKFFEPTQVVVQIKRERDKGSSGSGDDPLNNIPLRSPSPQTKPYSKRRNQMMKRLKNRHFTAKEKDCQVIPKYVLPKRDDITIFGEYIMSELRKVKDDYSLLVTKNKISNILFNAQIGKYKPENGTEPKAGDEQYFEDSL